MASPSPELAAWDLGAGETDVLAWAMSHREYTSVLDDRAARICAQNLDLPYVGTLGIVLAAVDAELVSAARPIHEGMKRAGYYIADSILERVLAKRGE